MTYTGTVVSWHSRKGYGFVECRDFEQDLYVHVSGFGGGELIEGKTISFDVQEDGRDGKKRCVNVEGDAVDRIRRDAPARRDSRDRYGDRDRDRDRYGSRGGGGRDRYDSRDRRGGGGGGRRYDSRDRYDRRDRYDSRDRSRRY
ncbi:hypothetical protein DIPPA_09229 [Diplonema papillatum]|nr:hypothetical protein DIPPA_09229 [Diplonema papillatum]